MAAHLSKHLSRPIIYVCPHIDDADNAVDDLQTFGADDVQLLPAWEGEEEIADATDEIRADRFKVVTRVSSKKETPNKERGLISLRRRCRRFASPYRNCRPSRAARCRFKPAKQTTPEEVSAWLIDNGFERTDKVDLPGQFARRGGIVDIYAPMMAFAADDLGKRGRKSVEFFGDTIESIRTIDFDSQV